MKYLFFDIECSDGKHICEFGYVITDYYFHVIKKECLLMNPEAKFTLTGRKNERDLDLKYCEEEYRRKPTFENYYDMIKSMLGKEDQLAIGFATNNDAGFLNCACKEYDLKPIEFKFCDTQRAYKHFFGKTLSLENTAKEMGISVPTRLHESSEDAMLTMEVFRQICERTLLSATEVFDLSCFINFSDVNKELVYFVDHPEAFGKKKRERILNEFIKKIRPRGDIIESELTGKGICFSKIYEQETLVECIILIQRIVDYGGHITSKASECNYYIKHEADDEETSHSRYHVVQATQNKLINVVSLDDLLVMLDLNKEQLKELPIPQVYEIKKVKEYVEEAHASQCLGKMIKNHKD